MPVEPEFGATGAALPRRVLAPGWIWRIRQSFSENSSLTETVRLLFLGHLSAAGVAHR